MNISAEACEKSSLWLWKESCACTGVRKPGNMCVTDRHDMTLTVKPALSPSTTNLPTNQGCLNLGFCGKGLVCVTLYHTVPCLVTHKKILLEKEKMLDTIKP